MNYSIEPNQGGVRVRLDVVIPPEMAEALAAYVMQNLPQTPAEQQAVIFGIIRQLKTAAAQSRHGR